MSPVSQLDSNEQYKYIRDGFVLQDGQLKLVRNGNLYRQDSPVTLKNGTIIMTDAHQNDKRKHAIIKRERFC